jgi:L-alanine-DL-glutamate epimerase-like enolase superfamily enzyme
MRIEAVGRKVRACGGWRPRRNIRLTFSAIDMALWDTGGKSSAVARHDARRVARPRPRSQRHAADLAAEHVVKAEAGACGEGVQADEDAARPAG